MRLTIMSSLLLAGTTLLGVPAHAAGDLNLICAADVVICEQMKGDFEKSHDIKVNMVRMSSGEAYAKIRAEARNPKPTYGGRHRRPASSGSFRKPDARVQVEDARPVAGLGKKSGRKRGLQDSRRLCRCAGWGYNTDIFKKKGYKEPKCWADLLAPELKGEIQIANPNSSGTAYTALASLVQIMGEDQAYDYLKKLNGNISQYTSRAPPPSRRRLVAKRRLESSSCMTPSRRRQKAFR